MHILIYLRLVIRKYTHISEHTWGVSFFAQGDVSFHWPDAAVPAIASLEKAGHDALSSDYHKYNQKMRQLRFNLKVRPLPAFFSRVCRHQYICIKYKKLLHFCTTVSQMYFFGLSKMQYFNLSLSIV